MLYAGIALIVIGLLLGLLGGPILFALVLVGLVLVAIPLLRGRDAQADAGR